MLNPRIVLLLLLVLLRNNSKTNDDRNDPPLSATDIPPWKKPQMKHWTRLLRKFGKCLTRSPRHLRNSFEISATVLTSSNGRLLWDTSHVKPASTRCWTWNPAVCAVARSTWWGTRQTQENASLPGALIQSAVMVKCAIHVWRRRAYFVIVTVRECTASIDGWIRTPKRNEKIQRPWLWAAASPSYTWIVVRMLNTMDGDRSKKGLHSMERLKLQPIGSKQTL